MTGSTVQVTAFSGSEPKSATLRLLSKSLPSPPGFSRDTVPSESEPAWSLLSESESVLSSDEDAELCPLLPSPSESPFE